MRKIVFIINLVCIFNMCSTIKLLYKVKKNNPYRFNCFDGKRKKNPTTIY